MKLYKYLPISLRTLEGLAKSQLWFSNPDSFNDPFDCNLDEVAKYSKTDIEAFYSRNDNGNKVDKCTVQYSLNNLDKFRDSALRHRKNTIAESGVLCLSKKYDDVLMWAHYADSHNGIVLKFDPSKDKQFFTHMIQVNYVDQYKPLNFAKNGESAIEYLLQHKSSHWSYEEEFRIIKTPLKIKNNSISRLFKYTKESLTDIYFGLNVSDECIQITKNIFSQNNQGSIKFHKARKAQHAFKLCFDQIH